MATVLLLKLSKTNCFCWGAFPVTEVLRRAPLAFPFLSTARVREDGRTGLAISDFFDFSIFVDAAVPDIREWYVDRFLRLRETAFRDPNSYFAKYAALSHDTSVDEARRIWDTINGPNLEQNVLPTRSRARLVLRKEADHSVRYVRVRKI